MLTDTPTPLPPLECEPCEGTGWRTWSTDHFSYSASSHYTREHTAECEQCDGTGFVTLMCVACSDAPATQGTGERWNDPNPYLCAECAAEMADAKEAA